ncbi:hypothetical protein IC582_006343 [Cucumis melo]|uniref:Phox/Bem1p n=2 Tax=Cucumis melo TaxID=3656 RepID=A0A5A7V9S3_CUCMM|nr:uncharacterized protein LOC103488147 [Cucumis melo]KAA0065072.1 Phox/Bem1p [Cucumis melo var. makuwa]
MDNYSYSSYPDSRDSSPRSCENPSWDDPSTNLNPTHHSYKVKFMCSYGGKIQPRAHDNQLTYTGGDTKILAVDRTITFSALSSRLSSLCCDVTVCFKYQLPGEDLDALISVTNDEDLEHMMLEYDRLYRVSKPARLRLFLFPLNPPVVPTILASQDPKSDRQWFVDALNSVRIQPLEDSSSPPVDPPGSASNPDFLFGFDKGYHPTPVPGSNLTDLPTSNTAVKDVSAGSDCGSEDRHLVGEPAVSPSEFQKQILDLQRLQVTNERSSDETNSKTSASDSHPPKIAEKIAPPPAAVPLPVPLAVPTAYFPDRQMISSGYTVAASANAPATDQSIYLIPTAAGLFQAQTLRPISGPVGHQPYYGMPTYREAQVHSSVAQPNVGVYTSEGIQMMQPKITVNEAGYTQVAYDHNTGRQVYFTTAPPYQTMAPVAVDHGRPSVGGGGGVSSYNPDGNVINTSKASGL